MRFFFACNKRYKVIQALESLPCLNYFLVLYFVLLPLLLICIPCLFRSFLWITSFLSSVIRLPQSQAKSIMITIIFVEIFQGPFISCIFHISYVDMINTSAINMCRLFHNLLESKFFKACCHIVMTLCHSTQVQVTTYHWWF